MSVLDCTPEDLLGPLNEVEQKHAPRTLYLAGKREVFNAGRRVSVVGSREASELGTLLLAEPGPPAPRIDEEEELVGALGDRQSK